MSTVARRTMTVSSLVLVSALWLVLLPIVLLVAALADLGRGAPWPAVRGALYFTVYLACELLGVLGAAVV